MPDRYLRRFPLRQRMEMGDFNIVEWLNIAARWIHVFAGIMWVGATYFFTWLDGRFAEISALSRQAAGASGGPEAPAPAGGGDPRVSPSLLPGAGKNAPGQMHQVWMLHSGGFYLVGKQQRPRPIPGKLHWFRWEAMITWASGMSLLVLVYYLGGLMVDDNMNETIPMTAGIGSIALGWPVYDLLWRSKLGSAKSQALGAGVSYVLLVGMIFALTRLMDGRAAYMHIGAMMGTLMMLNVWMRILPAQRKMVAALAEGREPDPALGERAKMRSKHNTYMAVPVVFIMISNHYPVASYGDSWNWIVLSAMILVGWGAAKLLRRA